MTACSPLQPVQSVTVYQFDKFPVMKDNLKNMHWVSENNLFVELPGRILYQKSAGRYWILGDEDDVYNGNTAPIYCQNLIREMVIDWMLPSPDEMLNLFRDLYNAYGSNSGALKLKNGSDFISNEMFGGGSRGIGPPIIITFPDGTTNTSTFSTRNILCTAKKGPVDVLPVKKDDGASFHKTMNN